jgi:hypothetical protein
VDVFSPTAATAIRFTLGSDGSRMARGPSSRAGGSSSGTIGSAAAPANMPIDKAADRSPIVFASFDGPVISA